VEEDRIRRPQLDRAEPYRNFASIWGSAGRHRNPDDPPTTQPEKQDGSFVADGVRSAYDVIESYLQQGQSVARQLGGLSSLQNSDGAEPGNLQGRWLQLTSELAANWFDLLGLLTETLIPAGAQAEPPAPQPAASSPVPAPAPAIKVAYAITSHQPALVELDFHPGRETRQLVSPGLRSMTQPDTCIDVAFGNDEAGQRLVVQIAIQPDQPAGLYSGVLLNQATGKPAGSLTLELG